MISVHSLNRGEEAATLGEPAVAANANTRRKALFILTTEECAKIVVERTEIQEL
jgi:hypothetical protein